MLLDVADTFFWLSVSDRWKSDAKFYVFMVHPCD